MTGFRTVQSLVRRTHEDRVLAVLRERGALTRTVLAQHAGLSRTTLSEITADLLRRGAVLVVAHDFGRQRGSGRRAELLALDPASGQFLGVDLGHTRTRVVVADAAHEVIGTGHRAYDAGTGWAQRQKIAFDLIEAVRRDNALHFGALQGVAVGVAGPDTTVRREVRAAFAARFDGHVIVDNNTRYAALAEALAEAPSEPSGDGASHEMIYLRVSDGIGGGIVTGGRLVPGGRGAAGEFGHVRVVQGGRECRCGKRGCLETVASMGALLDLAGVDEPEQLRRLLDDGDSRATAVLREAGAAIGGVLATAALILSPARIVIGGSVARAFGEVIPFAAAVVAHELAAVGSELPLIRAAELGDEDGVRGAVAALLQQTPLLAGYAGRGPTDDSGPTEASEDARAADRGETRSAHV